MEQYIISVVTALVGLVAYGVRQWLKTTLTPARMNALVSMARVAVTGAEEVGRFLEADGSEKYAIAETALFDMAKRLGLELTPNELNGLIHAVLYDQHQAEAFALNNDWSVRPSVDYGDDLEAVLASIEDEEAVPA